MRASAARSMRATARALKEDADPWKYHSKGEATSVWDKIRVAVATNPNSTTGNPLPEENRWPQPASRPEKFTVPASKSSDVAENPYYLRDVRRAYPQTVYLTQDQLSTLLLSQPSDLSALPAPGLTGDAASTALTRSEGPPSLSALYAGGAAAAAFVPPKAPGFRKLAWKLNEEVIPGNLELHGDA